MEGPKKRFGTARPELSLCPLELLHSGMPNSPVAPAQGEDQKKLDVISNEVFANCLRSRWAPHCSPPPLLPLKFRQNRP